MFHAALKPISQMTLVIGVKARVHHLSTALCTLAFPGDSRAFREYHARLLRSLYSPKLV